MGLGLWQTRAFFCALGLALAGCAHERIPVAWLPASELVVDEAKYADAAAVVLYRADKWSLNANGGSPYSQSLRHVALALRKESALGLAEVRLPYPAKATLLEVRARLRQPDGTVTELDPRAMLSDTSASGERDVNARYFRFPDVRVGSVLEYYALTEYPWLVTWENQDTVGDFPVKQYVFDLVASKPLVLEAIELNSTAPIRGYTLRNGQHELACRIDDIPTREPEPAQPHWTFTEPRWAYRVVAWRTVGQTYDVLRDWKDVVQRKAVEFFVEPKLYQGFDARADVAGCSDARCKVDHALALVRERTFTGDGAWDAQRPLKELLETRHGSAVERALLLRRALADAGVEAWLAYTTGRLSRQTSRAFPQLADFNHLLVWLPAQDGLAGPLFLDASCDFCAPGELRRPYAGVDALVFKATALAAGVGEPQVTAEWRQTPERAAAPWASVTRHEVRLDAAGDLLDRLTAQGGGSQALEMARHKALGTFTTAVARRQLRSIFPLGRLRSWRWLDCDAARGRCEVEREVSIPRYATPDGKRLLVPLTVMWTPFHGVFDKQRRAQDIHFSSDDETIEERVDFEVPEGYRLVESPPAKERALGGLRASFTVEPLARGARVTRRLTRPLGAWGADQYAAVRDTVEIFTNSRSGVLVFERP